MLSIDIYTYIYIINTYLHTYIYTYASQPMKRYWIEKNFMIGDFIRVVMQNVHDGIEI